MHEKELKKFIFEASRATYASGDTSLMKKELDRSTTITFTSGKYKSHDNYFGGEPYGGREVIFLDNKPIWIMVYYGFVHTDFNTKEVYPFLMEALSNNTEDMPYRGPKFYEKGNLPRRQGGWKYENKFVGELASFSGTEKIYKDNVCVYEASYIGGFVDF